MAVFDCDSIDALEVFSKLSCCISSAEKLPRRIHVCVAGQCDLAHPDVHANYNRQVPVNHLAAEMLGRHAHSAYFTVDLCRLLRNNRVHNVFHHTLDGHCLLQSFREKGALDPLQNFCCVVVCLVLIWLQRLADVTDAYVLCVCGQGKHRSVYMGRLVWFVLGMLNNMLGWQCEIRYRWLAKERVLASQKQEVPRQHPDCRWGIVAQWHSYFNTRRFMSVTLTDDFHAVCCIEGKFDLSKSMADVNVHPIGRVVELVGRDERVSVQFSSLVNSHNFLSSWLFFVRKGMKFVWPQHCGICCAETAWDWAQNLQSYFGPLVAETKLKLGMPEAKRQAMKRQEKIAWADQEESSSESDSSESVSREVDKDRRSGEKSSVSPGGMPLWAATRDSGASQSSGGSSLQTAQGSGGMSLWTAPDNQHKECIDRTTRAKSKPEKKTVHFDGGTTVVETQALDTYWQLKINTQRKIVLGFELADMTPAEAKIDAALALKPDSGPAYLVTDAHGDSNRLEDVAQKLFESNATVRSEMATLSLEVSTFCDGMTVQPGLGVLYQMQLFIFLHMLSILVDTEYAAFTASSQFIGLVGRWFHDHLHVDILELMARYLFLLWLAPPVDAQAWNGSFYGLLIPRNHLAAVSWWNKMQRYIREADDMAFCEEYLCITRELGEDALMQEIDELSHRFKAGPVRVAPEFPDYYYWNHHDAATTVADSVAAPRILQPFRTSAGAVDVNWGNNNGLSMEVSKTNCIQEAHSCVVVSKAAIPRDLMLSKLLGDCEEKLRKAFEAAKMPCPFWLQSASCGAVAHEAASSGAVADEAQIRTGSETASYISAMQYRILGLLFLASLKPDNVMHPHLRCHFDFHVGKFLSVEVRRGTLSQVAVSEFMRGCGIIFDTGAHGWLSEKLQKRMKTGTDLIGLHAHNLWGEKCRVQRYFDSHVDTLYLIAVSCQNQDRNNLPCLNHLEICGYGTLCNCYHAVCEKYCRQLMIHALQYTLCHGVRKRGHFRDERQEKEAFVYQVVGQMGFHSVENDEYHPNPDRRLQLFGLPRWLPRFYSDPVREKMPDVTFVSRPPCTRRYFSSKEMEQIAKVNKNQSKKYDGFECLLVELVKKAVTRSRVRVIVLE